MDNFSADYAILIGMKKLLIALIAAGSLLAQGGVMAQGQGRDSVDSIFPRYREAHRRTPSGIAYEEELLRKRRESEINERFKFYEEAIRKKNNEAADLQRRASSVLNNASYFIHVPLLGHLELGPRLYYNDTLNTEAEKKRAEAAQLEIIMEKNKSLYRIYLESMRKTGRPPIPNF